MTTAQGTGQVAFEVGQLLRKEQLYKCARQENHHSSNAVGCKMPVHFSFVYDI